MIVLHPALETEIGSEAVYPAFYLTIEGVPYIFGSGEVTQEFPLVMGAGKFFGPQPVGQPDAGVTYLFGSSATTSSSAVRRLFIPDGVGSQATPEQGDASWSGFLAEIQDCDEIRNAIADYDPLKGRTVAVFAGMSNLPTSQWAQVGAGTVDEVSQGDDYLSWRIDVVDFARWPRTSLFALLQAKLAANLVAANTTSVLVDSFSAWPTASGQVSDTQPFAVYALIDKEIIGWTAADATHIGVGAGSLKRGLFGSVAADHSSGAQVTEVFRLYGNPIDIDLWTKCSTGTGAPGAPGSNGAYDILPERHGLAMPQAFLLISGPSEKAYQSVKAALGTTPFDFIITEPVSDAKRWASLEIYKPNNCFPVTHGDGRQGLSLFKPPEPNVNLPTITPSDVITGSAKFSKNERRQFNRIDWFFDWDPIEKKFGRFPTVPNPASIAKYKKAYPLVVESRGMWSVGWSFDGTARTNGLTAGDALAISRGERALTRFAEPPPEIQCETTLRCFPIEMGDLVLFSSNFVIDPKTKLRGLGPVCCQVIGKQMDWKRGVMKFVLSYAFAGFRYGRIAPESMLDYPLNVGGLSDNQIEYAFLSEYPGVPQSGDPDPTSTPVLSSDGGTGNGTTSFRMA